MSPIQSQAVRGTAPPGHANAAVTPQRILQMAWGFGPPLILEAAVRTRIFDVLDGGEKTAAEVASLTGASERGVQSILDALVAFEFLARNGEHFSLTPESAAFLVSAKPSFHGGFLRHLSTQIIPKWLTLADIVRTGKPADRVNSPDTGAEFFKGFVKDLFPMNYPAARALAESLSEELGSHPAEVLDLAAGSGVWGIALAERLPNVRVAAVDWPMVTPVAEEVAARQGVRDRYRVINGDILTAELGSGYRVATLGHILHSEGEARSRTLLRRVHDALAPGGTIVIAEFVADEDRKGPPQAMIFAVNMLVNTDAGTTFSFRQMGSWLKEAGFERIRQLEVPGPSPLLLASKP